MKPKFFATPQEFREWLEKFHSFEQELWIGFHKKKSGKPSITWPEAVDALLCFGWIDGIRKSLDDTTYVIRVTPRKPNSTWSAVNIRRVAELTKTGLMRPAGLKAFEVRTDDRSAIYSYEQRKKAELSPGFDQKLRGVKKAWNYFTTQVPSYQRLAKFWVMSAKKEETRIKRLDQLIRDSANGRRLAASLPSRTKK